MHKTYLFPTILLFLSDLFPFFVDIIGIKPAPLNSCEGLQQMERNVIKIIQVKKKLRKII